MVRFLVYGVFGWCSEIIWTASYAFVAACLAKRKIDWRLAGNTYLWMFPVYGAGGLAFEVAHGLVADWSWLTRGVIYMVGCFAVEWWSGRLIERVSGTIPWDYSYSRFHVRGLIRLDYAPVWFVFGLLLERVEVIAKAIESALGSS